MRPGVTVADYLTGVFSAEAALAALYRRDATPGPRKRRVRGSQGTRFTHAVQPGRSPFHRRAGPLRRSN